MGSSVPSEQSKPPSGVLSPRSHAKCQNHSQGPSPEHNNVQITSDPVQVLEIINQQELANYRLGVGFILIALTTWIVGLELVNAVLKGDDYNKPWMFAVITGSCFMLYFIPDLLNLLRSLFVAGLNDGVTESSFSNQAMIDDQLRKDQEISHESCQLLEEFPDNQPVQLKRKEIIVLAIQIAVTYYLYNLFVMMSLQYTSASNQTVLSSTTSIFTLVLGVFVKIDKFTWKKVLCVTISTIGVLFVNLSESGGEPGGGSKFQPKNPMFGNILAIGGALMFSFYLLIMKVKCGTGKKTTNERQLFGLVGVCTFLLGCPTLIIIDRLGIEKFDFPPPSNKILFSILINGVFSVISDFSIILSMLLTSPLVTSLSLTTAIPITICIDFIILYFEDIENSKDSLSLVYILGITSILVSVILINVNITSENELIGEVIDETIEEAIKTDEVLSPVLSPLIGPSGSRFGSPFFGPHNRKINSPYNSPSGENFSNDLRSFQVGTSGKQMLATISPRLISRFKDSASNESLDDSNFSLNSNSNLENTPLQNANHSPTLYVVDSQEHLESQIQGRFIVYSSVNHSYHVKNFDSTN